MNDLIKKQLEAANLLEYFNKLSPSHQTQYLKWINEAKKPETMLRRISKMLDMLKANQS